MSKINKNTLIPLCFLALAGGYFGAEWVIPKYFKPNENTASYNFMHENNGDKADQFIAMLRQNNHYIRNTKSGNYLAGKFAQNNKDWTSANKFISQVLPPLPQENIENGSASKDLYSHAMILAMGAGEYKKAISLANDVHALDDNNIFATLFITVGYLNNAQYIEADKILSTLDQNSIATFITPILSLWLNTVNRDGSINKNITTKDLPATNIYVYHALLAGIFTGQKQAVEEYAIRAFNPNELDARDAEKFADIFFHYGQKDISLLLLKTLKDRNFSSEVIDKKIAALENDKDIVGLFTLPQIDTPKQGAALILSNMAEILVRERSDDVANIFAQMAAYLDPLLEMPHNVISDIYARNERFEDAIQQLANIPTNSTNFILTQRKIADFYNQMNNDAQAIKTLNLIYENTQDIDTLNQIGDIYRFQENYDKAIKTYSEILDKLDPLPSKYWYVLYARGMSYERLKKFEQSDTDLLKALEFQPNEPYLLNYLGYSWADRDIKLDESLELIKQAQSLRPDDGYIADSLGWVYFKLGDYENAVTYLERAVEMLPYDVTVNDHLGDAYWRNGREIEAKFQWRRALNNQEDIDLDLTTSLRNKTANGLPFGKSELSELPVQPSQSPDKKSHTVSDL